MQHFTGLTTGCTCRAAERPAGDPKRSADQSKSATIMTTHRLTTLVALLLLAAPLAAEAQQAGARRIGLLDTSSPSPARVQLWETLRQRLRELGYLEGRNIAFESRFGEGNLLRAGQVIE